MNYVGGMGMFVVYISAGLFVLLAPLIVLRVKKSSDKKMGYARQKRKHGVMLFCKDSGASMANFFSRFPSPHSKEEEYNTTVGDIDNHLPTALLMPADSSDGSGLSCEYFLCCVSITCITMSIIYLIMLRC